MKPPDPLTVEQSSPTGLQGRSTIRWTYWVGAGSFIGCIGFLFYVFIASEVRRTGATMTLFPHGIVAAAGFTSTTLFWFANAYFAYSPVKRENWQCLAGSKNEAKVIMRLTLKEWTVGGYLLRAQMRTFFLAFVLPVLLLTILMLQYGLNMPLDWLAASVAIAVIATAGVPRRRVLAFLCTTAYARERGHQLADFPRSPLRLFASPLFFRDAALKDTDSPLEP